MPFLKCQLYKTPHSRVLENRAQRYGLRHAIVTPSKDKYIGEWSRSQKHGYGSMLTRSDRAYEGNWMKNFRHNFGLSTYRDEDKVFILDYRGNWRYGHYGGFGEKHYRDHGYFKGFFKNSKRCGYGQMWYADGSFYDGDWCRDQRHGLGMFIQSNGNRYEGSWKEDLKHGRGRYFHLFTGQMQEGVWINDVCVTSFIVDIPFRQSAIMPTQYPIPQNKLQDYEKLYTDQEEEILSLNFRESTTSLSSNASFINKAFEKGKQDV